MFHRCFLSAYAWYVGCYDVLWCVMSLNLHGCALRCLVLCLNDFATSQDGWMFLPASWCLDYHILILRKEPDSPLCLFDPKCPLVFFWTKNAQSLPVDTPKFAGCLLEAFSHDLDLLLHAEEVQPSSLRCGSSPTFQGGSSWVLDDFYGFFSVLSHSCGVGLRCTTCKRAAGRMAPKGAHVEKESSKSQLVLESGYERKHERDPRS